MDTYTLPDLPYDPGALEPHLSARILELHHDKHHAAYVKAANSTLDQLHELRDKGDFAATAPLNTDDHPIVAYRAPRITYSPVSTPRVRLLELLANTDIGPNEILDGEANPVWDDRLSAYWTARNRFIEAGRNVRPTPDVRDMLAHVLNASQHSGATTARQLLAAALEAEVMDSETLQNAMSALRSSAVASLALAAPPRAGWRSHGALTPTPDPQEEQSEADDDER